MKRAVRPNTTDADEAWLRALVLGPPWLFGNAPAARTHVYVGTGEVRTMRFAQGSFTLLEPMRFTVSGQLSVEVFLQSSLPLDDTTEEPRRERIGDLLAASEERTWDPQADYAWFYSDRSRVERHAGRYVAVYRCRVVGEGTAREAYEAARSAGSASPLVFRVATESELESAELGL